MTKGNRIGTANPNLLCDTLSRRLLPFLISFCASFCFLVITGTHKINLFGIQIRLARNFMDHPG